MADTGDDDWKNSEVTVAPCAPLRSLYYWRPEPDISAFEVALALPFLTALHHMPHLFKIEELPDCVRRHFKTDEGTP